VYVFIGGLTGRFATTTRTLEAESARHFDLSLDMISIAGFDGRFKSVNPAFERTLGYRPDELVGRPFLDFVHPDDREKTEREAVSLADGAKTLQFQNRYLAKDGAVRWLEWTSMPLRDEGLIYGVANRRRFEEELRRQLAYTRRYGRGGALLMIDLDRFKQINDRLGHAAGDEALREVARVLSEEELLAAADRAMYLAKAGGGGGAKLAASPS
jgi:PAS domain S-box-containing protein